MNRMIQTAGLWWGGRSAREQRMLAVMGLLIAAVLVWLLVVRPAWAWREAAADRRIEATASLARIEGGLAARGATTKAEASASATMNLAEVEQAARSAAEATGLPVTLSVDETGGIGFDAPGVTSAALFGWLATLKTEYAVDAVDLTVIENADVTLDARGSLKGRAL
ncbi:MULTISPECIES: type II secretion system protein GspM [unclassified Brevundimonas]|uniref:type II secretion system protein GspM n=1 Tax=unclassified Brevundimonas TaxID=2622653 RepID=UPI0025BA77D1|nr:MULTISPECIES: type II secretion system protein GspM [unclassified Brevundimonas]